MEINRQREEMTLMNNYPCLFVSQIPLANGDWKTRAVLSAATKPPPLHLSFHQTHVLSLQRKPEMTGDIHLQFSALQQPHYGYESLWENQPQLKGLRSQVQITDCTHLWFCFWLCIPGVSRHPKCPSLGKLYVWCEVLNIMSFSSVWNSTTAPAGDIYVI